MLLRKKSRSTSAYSEIEPMSVAAIARLVSASWGWKEQWKEQIQQSKKYYKRFSVKSQYIAEIWHLDIPIIIDTSLSQKGNVSSHRNQKVVLVFNQKFQHILAELTRCCLLNKVFACLNRGKNGRLKNCSKSLRSHLVDF